MKKQNVRTLSLIVCTFTYLLVGAAIFDALESNNEDELRRKYLDEEDFFKKKYNITKEHFNDLRRNFWRANSYRSGRQWKFPGAFYFSLTVVTTIGEFCEHISIQIIIHFFLLNFRRERRGLTVTFKFICVPWCSSANQKIYCHNVWQRTCGTTT